MMQQSSPLDFHRKVVAIALLAMLILTGCTPDKGPSVSKAGQTLKSDILRLLEERNAENVAITDPGGKDIPCGEGKAKRTFAATGRDLPKRKPDALVDALLGAVKRVGAYEIVSTGDPGQPIRVENKAAHTILILDAPGDGQYAVSGETGCLDAR
ncbi:hypothetical protein [Sphaerisporangium dianthi]|uniref:Lipoprotein n=1 Tax=Sphaerisporangium dianthi TaxID=1436120 RepID=A0ABV9CGD8_9ACTN